MEDEADGEEDGVEEEVRVVEVVDEDDGEQVDIEVPVVEALSGGPCLTPASPVWPSELLLYAPGKNLRASCAPG